MLWTDNDKGDGPLHTNFKLSGDGEEIGLFGRLAAGNEVIDSYVFGIQTTDTSEGRTTDGSSTWRTFGSPTPGTSNHVSDTSCVGIRGNIDGDAGDVIDISNLVWLVDYMFTGGPPPPSMEEGNIDGIGAIDISDLVYLVDYMFIGGSPPEACP